MPPIVRTQIMFHHLENYHTDVPIPLYMVFYVLHVSQHSANPFGLAQPVYRLLSEVQGADIIRWGLERKGSLSEASQRITPSQPHAGTDGGHSLSSHTVVSRGSYWGGGHTRPLKMTVWEAMSQSGFITSLVVFVHPQTGDGTTISLWSSKPHEGLTICRFQSKGSTFFSVILRPLSIGPAGV